MIFLWYNAFHSDLKLIQGLIRGNCLWERLLKKEITDVSSELSIVLDQEQDAFNNMPEGLQSSYRGMCSEDSIDLMEEAIDSLDDAIKSLGDIL